MNINLKTKKIRWFNLVEITLAIGVIAYGMASVMSLSVIASRQTRDASTETVISQVAESVFSLFEVRARVTNRWLCQNGWIEGPYIGYADYSSPSGSGYVSDEFYVNGSDNLKNIERQRLYGIENSLLWSYNKMYNACLSGDVMAPISTQLDASDVKYYFQTVSREVNSFEGMPTNAVWVCRVIQEEGYGDEKVETIGFSCFVRMWRQVGGGYHGESGCAMHTFRVPTLWQYQIFHITSEVSLNSNQVSSLFSVGRVYVEITWPIDVAETFRQKRIYYKEFCK